MSGIHFARIQKSKRLQVLLKCLRTGPKTTLQLSDAAQGLSMSISTSISEIRHQLRERGQDIKCSFRNFSETGAKVYLYRIVKK